MADAEACSYKRLSERARLGLIVIVSSFLNPEDAAKAAAGSLKTKDIEVGHGSPAYTKSPISRAVDLIVADPKLREKLQLPPQPDSAKTKTAVKNACDYWFWEIASSNRQSLADEPRRTKGNWGLDDVEFQLMGHYLTTTLWLDEHDNWRQFGSLEKMLKEWERMLGLDPSAHGGLTREDREELQHRVDELKRIREKATGRAHGDLDILLPRVVEKCRCG